MSHLILYTSYICNKMFLSGVGVSNLYYPKSHFKPFLIKKKTGWNLKTYLVGM